MTRRAAHRSALALAAALTLSVTACTGGPAAPGSSVPGSSAPSTTPQPGTTPQSSPPPASDAQDERAPGLPSTGTRSPVLRFEQVTSLEAPIDTAVLPDGTVLVAERAGRVRVLIPAPTAPSSDPASASRPSAGDLLLDVSGRTTTDGERGLLSIAIRPDGSELFLSLTDADGDTRVEAHPLVDSRISGPPRTIYTLAQPQANHNGGPLVFTPDGLLLLGLGDGGGGGDPLGAGQDLSTPLGAIVRLDISGDGPGLAAADNPFLDRFDAAPEIAAYGLSNPWRMTYDHPRGELWIADVGQSAREEIDRVTLSELLGANFGWALREGDVEFSGDEPDDHVPPVHTYGHGPRCSITGGLVYRGSALPELVGGYVFSDLCDGELLVLEFGGRVLRLVRG